MKRVVLFLVAIFMTLGLAGCDQEWRWHQKLTVTVDTPTGQKMASSVQEGVIVKYGWWQRQWGYSGGTALKGEAVALEVAPGKYLFALLKGTPLAWSVFLGDKTPMEVAGPALVSMNGTRALLLNQYPLLVTFRDIKDPASIRLIDPQNLAASFGPGLRLDSVTMTMTGEPMTHGNVQSVLDWLCRYKQKRLRLSGRSGPIADNGLANNIGSGDLKTEDCR